MEQLRYPFLPWQKSGASHVKVLHAESGATNYVHPGNNYFALKTAGRFST